MRSRTVADLVDYYYNVLKLRTSAAAVQWYEDKAQVCVHVQGFRGRALLARPGCVLLLASNISAHHLQDFMPWICA